MKPLTIVEAAVALRRGDVSAGALVDNAISRADEDDDRLGVFVSRRVDAAREAAIEVDARIAQGEQLRPLDGIPIGVKDIIAESGGPTTAQSLAFEPGWGVGKGDAAVVTRLKQAGAIVMGKLTTMEFAIGAPDETKPFPVPRNPWDLDRWAGGSSSGSGSGVSAGMFLGAIGTDTAGSVRMPAAFTGVTGLKPTFGRISRTGIVPLSFTLDHVGPMARSAADCALMLSCMAGHDPADPYSADARVDDYEIGLNGDLTGVRIGVDDLDRYATGGIDAEQPALFAAAVRLLEDAGATVVPVQAPMYEECSAIDFVVMLGEAFALHEARLRRRWDDYGLATRVILAGGAVVTGADLVHAQRVRRLGQERMTDLLRTVDLLVTPTSHLGAPKLEAMDGLDPLGIVPSLHLAYWNALGNPTLSVPIGLSSELTPLSLSISGPLWSEALVLRAGDALQRRSSHHLAFPPIKRVQRDPSESATAGFASAGRASSDGGGRKELNPFSDDPAENAAVGTLQSAVEAMSRSLRDVPLGPWSEPAGGFAIDR